MSLLIEFTSYASPDAIASASKPLNGSTTPPLHVLLVLYIAPALLMYSVGTQHREQNHGSARLARQLICFRFACAVPHPFS